MVSGFANHETGLVARVPAIHFVFVVGRVAERRRLLSHRGQLAFQARVRHVALATGVIPTVSPGVEPGPLL